MTIPQKVRINGVDYDVIKLAAKEGLIISEATGAEVAGDIHYAGAFMRICECLAPGQQQVVFWHEVLHAILLNAETDKVPTIPDHLLTTIARGINQVLEDNQLG